MTHSPIWLRLSLLAALLTAVLHVAVLLTSDLDPVVSPISELSLQRFGPWQTLGLLLFGLAHVALARGLAGLDPSALWTYARGLLLASGFVLAYIAWDFAPLSAGAVASTSDPLWIVATLTGLAMGALQPGLARIAPRVSIFSAICLGLWLWLVPTILLVTDAWLGAYERIVGTVYVTWIVGISLALAEGSGRRQT
ncbi:MAG: DUF998 domain-containing protein [Pseudomonadota bacterium]